MSCRSSSFQEIALIGIASTNIRNLAGFDRKLHSVPAQGDERAAKFVSEIAMSDLEKDIESMFQQLRKAFKLKRNQVITSFPEPGWGVIEIPYFDYSINVGLDTQHPSQVLWERSIRSIRSTDIVSDPQFSSIFDNLFDRIELEFAQPIVVEEWIDNIESNSNDHFELHYDSAATECVLEIIDLTASIQVQNSKFAVVHPGTAPVREILSSYLKASDAIEEGFKVGAD